MIIPLSVKVFSHDSSAGEFFSSPEDAYNKNADNENAALYSILDHLEEFRSFDGKFRFKLCYPFVRDECNQDEGECVTEEKCNEWIQKSNPAEEFKIEGFEPISLVYKENSKNEHWAGLGKNVVGGPSLIDDTPDSSSVHWYSAIGAYKSWMSPTTFPGPRPLAVYKVQLFVKKVE